MASLSLYKETSRVVRKAIIYGYFKESSWEDSTTEVNIITKSYLSRIEIIVIWRTPAYSLDDASIVFHSSSEHPAFMK